MYHINKKITGSGENIELKNTAKHYFKEFSISGNSKQENREGYNLLKLEDKTISSGGVVAVISNGKITINGTPETLNFNQTIGKETITEAGTYSLLPFKSSTNANIRLIYKINNGAWASEDNNPIFELAVGDILDINLRIDNTNTITNFTMTPMLILGTESKPYEQYGASPSIEHESPIESVGDNINLLDTNLSVLGFINDTGVLSDSGSTKTSDYIKVSVGKTYTFSYEISSTSGSPRRIALYDTDKTFNSIIATYTTNVTTNISFTPTIDGYVRISYDINSTNEKLQKGTKATAYSPYGQGSIEVYNCNKNLFNLDDFTGTSAGVTITKTGDTFVLNGTATNNNTLVYTPPEILKLLGDYTLSVKYISGTKSGTSNFNIRDYDTNSGIIGTNLTTSDTYNTKTFEETTQIRFGMYINGGSTFTDYTFKVQLEKGLTATEYQEHQSQTKALYTQQPFRGIGDVKDRFVKQNGVWYEEHNVKRLILNGTENWGKSSNTNNNIFYIQAIINTLINKGISNYFTYQIVWDVDKVGVEIYNNRNVRFGLGLNSEITTLERWKAKVTELYNAGTPLYVDYVLATPRLIECTPEQVEQLEYFEKEAYSYDEVTHIYSTDEVSPYFEVTAYERISEEFKTRLKEGKITRGYLKVLATDTLPEIIIDENNYLKDLKIEELRYVPEEGIIGGTVAKRVSGNFNNVDSLFDIQDREIEVYLGVELEDETTEYIKYGTYIVQRPEDDQVNDNTSFEALDYMIKLNQEYKDRITYPCTLKQLLDDIIDQAGVNSKVATFANSDFIVENNQFEQGSTLRDVIKAIAQVAFNWARIDEDDNFVMDFEMNENIDEELGTDDYFSFKKMDNYGPVNVIVLRNSQVEGENVTIKDEKLINSPKGYNLLNNLAETQTIEGITFTVNEDKTVLVNGIAEQDTVLLIQGTTEYPEGDYILSDSVASDSSTYFLRIYSGETGYNTIAQDTNTPSKFTLTEPTKIRVYIIIRAGVNVNNILFKPMIVKGKEEKPYQPYIPNGEVELVIADNPFAYTELKRKQLIEAGRRLFGLRYTPMTVDMLGLIYLNAKDRISVENLNGEKFNTYLLDHTIDYTGIVLDSMQSQAKTKTETKYQYVSPLFQGLSHVEIKVDKANKKIESIVQTQEDVSEKVAKTVARIEVVYALSDSPVEAPTEGWSTTAPEWVEGKYMWQKTITTYANGSTAETAATNISGAQGKDGISGNNSYSYVAFSNSADGSKDFSRTDSTNKTYIGTLTINESVNENLLRNTNKGTTNWGYATQNGAVSKEQYTEEGKNAVKLICTTASTGWQYASYSLGNDVLKKIKERTNYILSFDIKTNIGPSTLEVAIKKGDGTNAIAQGVKAEVQGDETWEHFSVQLQTISDFSNITIGGQVLYFIGMNKVGYYIIENLKLEEGYRETSYSKSPEDLANDYTQYYWQYTKGEEGVGVKSVIDQYYSSTSSTELAEGEWKETQDTLQTDRFIWTRSKITWTNGNVTYTDPILANTLNDINSNIIAFKDFKATQESTNEGIKSTVEETTKKLNNEYLTADKVNEKIDKIDNDYTILESRVAQTELDSKSFKISIETIQNTGVDKIKTSMGYTFNDDGLNIDRTGSDTSTVIDEAKIKVTDKTGGQPKSLLYAGYVKEGDTEFSDYEGQTIVATSNLIVQNFLIIGSNSRFQDYYNETLGGNGTGAFDI